MAKERKTDAFVRGYEVPSALTGAAKLLDHSAPKSKTHAPPKSQASKALRGYWKSVGGYITKATQEYQPNLKKAADES